MLRGTFFIFLMRTIYIKILQTAQGASCSVIKKKKSSILISAKTTSGNKMAYLLPYWLLIVL